MYINECSCRSMITTDVIIYFLRLDLRLILYTHWIIWMYEHAVSYYCTYRETEEKTRYHIIKQKMSCIFRKKCDKSRTFGTSKLRHSIIYSSSLINTQLVIYFRHIILLRSLQSYFCHLRLYSESKKSNPYCTHLLNTRV